MTPRTTQIPDSDQKLLQTELLLSFILKYGVLLCILVISIGMGMRLLHVGSAQLSSEEMVHALVRGEMIPSAPLPVSVSEFWTGLAGLDADIITAAGLALLIGLPILRVAMTVVLFALERDRVYFFITLLVLTVLLSGIYFGKAL